VTKVTFGGVEAKSPDRLLRLGYVTVPRHPTGTVHVRVTTAYGRSTVSAADEFTYYDPAAPTVHWGDAQPVDPPQGPILATACASPSFCIAGDGAGNVLNWDGTQWSGPAKVAQSAFTAMSCPSASFWRRGDKRRLRHHVRRCVLDNTGSCRSSPAAVLRQHRTDLVLLGQPLHGGAGPALRRTDNGSIPGRDLVSAGGLRSGIPTASPCHARPTRSAWL